MNNIPPLRTLIARGLKRRCPHCGEGALFERRLELFERCAHCGFRYELNRGDTWGFWVLLDRLLIGLPVLIFFIGFMPPGPRVFYWWAAVVVLIVLATMQQRFGLCVALDYLSRRKARDPKDEFPPISAGERAGAGAGRDSRADETQLDHAESRRRE